MNIKSTIGLYINVHRCVSCSCYISCIYTWIVYFYGFDGIGQNIACASRVYFCLFSLFCFFFFC